MFHQPGAGLIFWNRVRAQGTADAPIRFLPARDDTPWGAVRVKVRDAPDGAEGTPEYEDCRRLAHETGVSLRAIIDEAKRVM